MTAAATLPAGGRRLPEPCLHPVLGHQDDLENALQQDGREQGDREGLGEYLRDVLHEQVQHDHVDEDVDDRGRHVGFHGRGGVRVAIRHMITVAIVAGDEDRVTVALSGSGERRSRK